MVTQKPCHHLKGQRVTVGAKPRVSALEHEHLMWDEELLPVPYPLQGLQVRWHSRLEQGSPCTWTPRVWGQARENREAPGLCGGGGKSAGRMKDANPGFAEGWECPPSSGL
jgi:hypothetical protein